MARQPLDLPLHLLELIRACWLGLVLSAASLIDGTAAPTPEQPFKPSSDPRISVNATNKSRVAVSPQTDTRLSAPLVA
jgi:hypothetical protein